jgi:TolB-like protein/DNA-binding winged helix-turn-helix (wHTH) protein
VPAKLLEFDQFSLDCDRYELRRSGRPVKLEKIPMELLILLVTKDGRLVTRQEIIEHLWGTEVFVDTEHGINTAIRKIRNVLRDDPERPRFVQTVTGKGYRFVAPIDLIAQERGNGNHNGTKLVPPETTQTQTDGQVPSPLRQSHYHVGGVLRKAALVLVGAIGIVAVLVGVEVRGVRQRLFAHAGKPRIRSLAVLPLENLSADPAQDYFSDGLTEALTNDLGKFSALRVISRTSTMQYKSTKKTVPEIARDLDVDAVIEGTVLRSGNHMRITVNLIQAHPERHLWAESYEAEAGNIMNVPAAVALSVAREIQITFTPSERSLLNSRTVNPAAQDLYFRGLHAWDSGTAEGTKNAVGYFQRSLERDPKYALAYAGLALAHVDWRPGLSGPQENMPKAREAALKGLALDETLPLGHSVMGSIQLYFDWNWAGAEKEFKRALELNPNDYLTYNAYARFLVAMGRTDEALTYVKTAMSLDPFWNGDYPIWVTYLARRYDEALELAKTKSALDPNNPWYHFDLALVYEQIGRSTESVEEYLKFETLSGTDPQTIARLRQASGRSGMDGFWRRRVEEYRKAAKSQYVSNGMVAEACSRIGESECALESLERAFRERDDLMINLNVDPAFDGIRTDPHFQDLVRRVGLPEAKPQT